VGQGVAYEMNRQEFFERIRSSTPKVLAEEFLAAETAHAFPDPSTYKTFRDKIGGLVSAIESVAVVGSGNWRYSLNPEKAFREFGAHSDVDVAIVSSIQFRELWDEMRRNHRRHYYALSFEDRTRLRRNSENVYAGFISPGWIPNRNSKRTYEHKRTLNALSDKAVEFRKVRMMFFKNFDEAVDYYARGFGAARRTIQ
jgi:hypothetical protein